MAVIVSTSISIEDAQTLREQGLSASTLLQYAIRNRDLLGNAQKMRDTIQFMFSFLEKNNLVEAWEKYYDLEKAKTDLQQRAFERRTSQKNQQD